MMFPWNIAKSAELMFSRWAMKRVCKFLLKKKLGQFILGEIDLDQLDVQLRAGTIQLSDLALNVDFLNQKLGQAGPVMIKEGSIGSLLVTMPWKGKGFEVEVDELELLVTPCTDRVSRSKEEACTSDHQGRNYTNHESLKLKSGEDYMGSTSMDVHEGVKTIARMVKWFLTSFHVKVKRLIVAYDPYPDRDGSNSGSCPNLVLRVSEIECGTCVSEDADSESDTDKQNILGISCLTNFFSFRGAILELLILDDVSMRYSCPGSPALNATVPIITGEASGFSGTMKVSIPWKDGSLDTSKVDVNAAVDPIILRIEPSTIKWMLMYWGSLKHLENDHRKTTSSVYYPASSQLFSSTFSSAMSVTDRFNTEESLPSGTKSSSGKEQAASCLLPASLIISDWVPSSVRRNQTEESYEGLDFGASVEQFFECFDELRSSQTTLASSGILNWTCSVFNAITAASNLASGSYYVSPEQKHTEVNVRATVARISAVLSFDGDDESLSPDLEKNKMKDSSNREHLIVDGETFLIELQVCPQETKLDATIEHIEVAYLSDWKSNANFGSAGSDNGVQHLQYAVEGALPPLFMQVRPDVRKSSRHNSVETDINSCMNWLCCTGLELDNKLKVELLRTAGLLHCQAALITGNGDDRTKMPTTFSLRLPPFVLWVDFRVINLILKLLVNLRSEIGTSSEVLSAKHRGIENGVMKNTQLLVNVPSKDKLQGNVYLIDARIIFCFPSGNDPTDCTLWDQFIAIDFSSPILGSELRKEMTSLGSLKKNLPLETSCSLHLNFGNVESHLLNRAHNDVMKVLEELPCKFSSQKVFSIIGKSGRRSIVNVVWQEGLQTGPSITEKAKILATSGMGSGNKFNGKGYEFASVNAVKDPRKREESSSKARNGFILSSSIIVHIYVAPVIVNLNGESYKQLHHLSNQVKSRVVHMPANMEEDRAASQTSVLVQCDSLEVLIVLDKQEALKKSLQSELPGSWHSMKLNVMKFEFLSVSDLGGTKEANFLWASHSEGKLWGKVFDLPEYEFLLISCNNSSMKRGDGEGSNSLSTSFAGSDIIHLWEPGSCQNLTSVTIRCATMVAVGGRLDWLDVIPSFFIIFSEAEAADFSTLQESNLPKGSSFGLSLVDIGLSYEPHRNLVAASVDGFDFVPPCSATAEDDELYFSCLLAAASLSLSSSTASNSKEEAFKIRVQDLGLLLSPVSPPLYVSDPYCTDHLRKVGYTKVAGEALLEAVIRTNCKNGLQWEVECFESHIDLETRYDTTLGLMRLASQLQQLFAPDLEESAVHLQTRWDNVQHVQESNNIYEGRTHYDKYSSSASINSSSSKQSTSNMSGLMDEVCEDAFHLDEDLGKDVSSKLQFQFSHGGSSTKDAKLSSEHPPLCTSLSESAAVKGIHFHDDSCPDFIEDYCISDLCSLTELSPQSLTSKDLGFKSNIMGNASVGVRNGWYQGTSMKIVDDHISKLSEDADQLQFGESSFPHLLSSTAQNTVNAMGRIMLKNVNIRWRMHAGSSWYSTEKDRQLPPDVKGKDSAKCLEFALCTIRVHYEIFPDSEVLASKLALSVQDFHLYDTSKDAPWKLVLGYYHSKDHPRVSSSKAFKLNLEAVRPDPATPLEEYRLSVAFLPILVHLHQSQLDFLTGFFGGISPSVDTDPLVGSGSNLTVGKAQKIGVQTIAEEALLPFFQKFDIWPVLLRVDYTPRGVDLPALGGGKYAELVNIVPWKGIEIQLKHVHAMGIYGWGSVCDRIVGEWLEDISQNQIHKLLRGLPTIRSLVSVGSGAAKLISLPVKSYRKDHKLLKGMQRGTVAFLRSISLEAVALGVHLAAGAHDILFQAEYILSNIPPSKSQPAKSKEKDNIRANQPEDAQQGIIQAYESLSSGLGEAASAIIGTPLKRYHNGASPGSALASAVCATPAAAIAPASAAVRAVHCALLGFRNSLDPEHKKESFEKYLGGPSQSPERHMKL